MRPSLACCIVLLGLLCISVCAEDVSFDGGWLRCQWTLDLQYLTIEAAVDALPPPGAIHMWVLTVYGHRFEDGLFAWQLHFSETIDSMLVLPNDFLTARHFTSDQLGIKAELAPSGAALSLRLPVLGVIPRLVAVGDLIELHALWIQQAPLASMVVPAAEEAVQQEGGGASSPGSEDESISVTPLPEVDRFERGRPISGRFVVQDHPDLDALQRIVLSYTLMRLHENQPAEFVRFAHISYDLDTSIYSYTIDTSSLEPGRYSLLIGSSNSPLAWRMELEIIPPLE